MLLQRTRELGIAVHLETRVESIESIKIDDSNKIGFVVHAINTAKNEKITTNADMVVHGAGRVPELDDLDLGTACVQSEKMRGVKVNEYLQSVSNICSIRSGKWSITVDSCSYI